ncbi:MAG: hypothetical protein M3Y07_16265 [Acidobacteriota bacterium]|nr:hypothetical protein [Acidobacteriota bacterium]
MVSADYHGNLGLAATFTTTPAGSIDQRRVGVRLTGAYWGAGGEQMDVLSENLNFTMPLFKAQARGGSPGWDARHTFGQRHVHGADRLQGPGSHPRDGLVFSLELAQNLIAYGVGINYRGAVAH